MIELGKKRSEEIELLFLKHFNHKDQLDSLLISHPKDTKNGCLHIDVGILKDDYTYCFSFGCSNRRNAENRYVEVYNINEDNIIYDAIIRDTTYYNDINNQLSMLENNGYMCFDSKDHILREKSNDKICGIFLYDSFSAVLKNRTILNVLEMIPAGKKEIEFIESHRDVKYQDLIRNFKPFLGNRLKLDNVNNF